MAHGLTGDSATYPPASVDNFVSAVSSTQQLGDVRIKSYLNVGAYWRGQAAISRVRATKSGNDQTWKWTLPACFPPNKCVRVTVNGGTLSQGGKTLAGVRLL